MIAKDERIAFYVKCRPQNADAIDLVKKVKRVFIGYPAWRKNWSWNAKDVKRALIDISISEPDWDHKLIDKKQSASIRQINTNRNLVRDISEGSMVAIPRPGEGICWLARTTGTFELVNEIPWADYYLQLREDQELDSAIEDAPLYLADVVQSWPVTQLRKVPFPTIPGWIVYRLLSRNTIGRIYDRPDDARRAVDVLDELYRRVYVYDFHPTSSVSKIKQRLLEWLSPASFEHLVVSVLQLDQPHLKWIHTGGSGDGGTDGIALDTVENRISAVVQCKWVYNGDPVTLGETLHKQIVKEWGQECQVYVATLYQRGAISNSTQNITHLDADFFAERLCKYRKNHPMAHSLSVR